MKKNIRKIGKDTYSIHEPLVFYPYTLCFSERKLQKLNKGRPPGSFKLEAKLAADLKKQLRPAD